MTELKANEIYIEEIHKEIDLVQGCINRMAQNSFSIKGWTVTLFAVVLALLPESVDGKFLGLIMLAIALMLWGMDSFFLMTEKNYRKVYSWILKERPTGNRALLYELNFSLFLEETEHTDNPIQKASFWKTFFSKTLIGFYCIPTVISVLYLIVQLCICQVQWC